MYNNNNISIYIKTLYIHDYIECELKLVSSDIL